MNKEQFIIEIKKLGINITDEMFLKLKKYYDLLVSCNEKVNLTAIIKEEDVYLKHFYDSLTLIKAVDLTKKLTLCDVGTGAGFPGLVLKIVFPNLSITLVDSLEKRIKFLDQVINELDLKDITTIHSRIEDLKCCEKFDLVVSRAVAKINILLELLCQLPKVNGYVLLMKGNITEELKESNNAINKLNYKLINTVSFTLPIENSERNIVVLQKIQATNSLYPRLFSKIKNKTL